MSSAVNPAGNSNIAHEAESQRQHARLKLPANITFSDPDGNRYSSELLDLSAGGFSLPQPIRPLKPGAHCIGKMHFVIDGLSMAIDIEFQVRAVYAEGERLGCEFHNLRQREISALRYLITSYLAGEMVTMGDMLNTLQRNNFGNVRGTPTGDNMDALSRLRAFVMSAVFLLIGLIAFGYVLSQLYNLYLVTHADSAVVSVPSQVVSMPRDGSVVSLVKVGDKVSRGTALATLSANMLDVLKGSLPEADLSPDNIERLFNRTLQGTLTSTCDCRVSAQLVTNGQAVAKGNPVFELAETDGVASIDARFPYKVFPKVQPGTSVTFTVAGETQERQGSITSSVLQQGGPNGLASDIRVTITPATPLPLNLAGRPVAVSIVGLPNGGLFDKILAIGK